MQTHKVSPGPCCSGGGAVAGLPLPSPAVLLRSQAITATLRTQSSRAMRPHPHPHPGEHRWAHPLAKGTQGLLFQGGLRARQRQGGPIRRQGPPKSWLSLQAGEWGLGASESDSVQSTLTASGAWGSLRHLPNGRGSQTTLCALRAPSSSCLLSATSFSDPPRIPRAVSCLFTESLGWW